MIKVERVKSSNELLGKLMWGVAVTWRNSLNMHIPGKIDTLVNSNLIYRITMARWLTLLQCRRIQLNCWYQDNVVVVRSELWSTLSTTISLKISFRLCTFTTWVPGHVFLLYVGFLMPLLPPVTQHMHAHHFFWKFLLTSPGFNNVTGQIFLMPSKRNSCMLNYLDMKKFC